MAQAASDLHTHKPHLKHASCVALDARAALLIIGDSGSGKSTLALSLMALGAHLVADDQTELTVVDGQIHARAPSTIAGKIEARGVGLLAAQPLARAIVRGVVDLSRVETDRLPPHHSTDLLGIALPLLLRVEGPHFAPALIQWLKGGRLA